MKKRLKTGLTQGLCISYRMLFCAPSSTRPGAVSHRRQLTQTSPGPGSLHLAPQLRPQVELLCLIDEVSALEAAADERLEHRAEGGVAPLMS